MTSGSARLTSCAFLALQRLRRDVALYARELQRRFEAAGSYESSADIEIPVQDFEASRPVPDFFSITSWISARIRVALYGF